MDGASTGATTSTNVGQPTIPQVMAGGSTIIRRKFPGIKDVKKKKNFLKKLPKAAIFGFNESGALGNSDWWDRPEKKDLEYYGVLKTARKTNYFKPSSQHNYEGVKKVKEYPGFFSPHNKNK